MEYFLIALFGLLSSLFFSGAETAFVSVNKVKVELWNRQNLPGSKLIKDFILHPEKFLLTTLVGTNLANITCVTYSTIFFVKILGWDPAVTWIVVSLSVLFIGEIFPKYFFRNYADYFVRKIAFPLGLAYYTMFLIIVLVGSISSMILKIFGLKKTDVSDFYTKKDLEILLRETGKSTENSKDPDKMILNNLLEFRDVKVRDAMIPRTDIIAADEKITISQLKKLFIKSGRTRIPIYKDNLDNIIGIANMKDLFSGMESITKTLHPPVFVPEYKSAGQLLKEFRERSQSIAIVVDEYGGTAGLVTTEDLIEVLFGEIQDEFDQERKYIIKIDDSHYKIHARTEIEEFNEELKAAIPEGDYDTVGGFLLHQLGHIPKRDEEYEFNNLKFHITKATRRSVEWIKVSILEQ